MSKLPHIQLYPGDWLKDNLAGCSLAAQGLWLRMMFMAHDAERYGYLAMNGSAIPSDFIARKCGCDGLAQYETLLAELDRAGVPSRTPDGVIYSRRMVRDAKARAATKDRVAAHRARNGGSNGSSNAVSNAAVTPNDNAGGIDSGDGRRVEGGGSPEPMVRRMAYPPALAGSKAFIELWEQKWLPYLLDKTGRMPTLHTETIQLQECADMGVTRATAAVNNAISIGLRKPAEPFAPKHGAPATGSHFPTVRDWEVEPDDWKAIWRETYPPEDCPQAPRYEDGTWAEVRADHKKHIHELAKKRRRRVS